MIVNLTFQQPSPDITADAIGFVLVKHPERVRSVEVNSSTTCTVIFPEVDAERTVVSVICKTDPLDLSKALPYSLAGYVNDLPWSQGTIMAQAFSKLFRSTLQGKCEQPALVEALWPVHVELPAVRCWPGDATAFFSPLGYLVVEGAVEMSDNDPRSPSYDMQELAVRSISLHHPGVTAQNLLRHLCVLLPALDGRRHHVLDPMVSAKLIDNGEGWLHDHPDLRRIVKRYLVAAGRATRSEVLVELARRVKLDTRNGDEEGEESEGAPESTDATGEDAASEDTPTAAAVKAAPDEEQAKAPTLAQQRRETIKSLLTQWWCESVQVPEITIDHEGKVQIIDAANYCRPPLPFPLVVEFGCGHGLLMEELAEADWCCLGVDASPRAVAVANRFARRKKLSVHAECGSVLYELPPIYIGEHGVPTTKTPSEANAQEPVIPWAHVATEVIEHIEPDMLDAFTAGLFQGCPKVVIVTTPNRAYNVVWGLLGFRHSDHRFEWNATEMERWVTATARRYGYTATWGTIGEEDAEHPECGGPTFLCAFVRRDERLTSFEALRASYRALPNPITTAIIDTGEDLAGIVKLPYGHRVSALESLARYTLPYDKLPWIPPTMSPADAEMTGPELETPEGAIRYFVEHGVTSVIAEGKHMGSRAVVMARRDDFANGWIYTRMGRRFFADPTEERLLLSRVNDALTASAAWERLSTDWILFDAELLPWSLKAGGLISRLYAPVADAGLASLLRVCHKTNAWLARKVDSPEDDPDYAAVVQMLKEAIRARTSMQACAKQLWHFAGVNQPVQLAPFQILATEGRTWFTTPHREHLAEMDQWVVAAELMSTPAALVLTPSCTVYDITNPEEAAGLVQFYQNLISNGWEGMVVKPAVPLTHTDTGLVQPGIKVRNLEYLRIIYGPMYLHDINRLRNRKTRYKRSLAIREHALGIRALEAFVAAGGRVTPEVHRYVFATLALELEPTDPRL